jgi:hypothetical protein
MESVWLVRVAPVRARHSDRSLPSVSLHQVVLALRTRAHDQDHAKQLSPTVAARIEERRARWLLMASDRADGNEVLLTHDTDPA